MKICNYCGEYKEVREEYSIDIGFGRKTMLGTYICKECDEAFEIIYKISELKRRRLIREKQKTWIKERNKILSN